MARYDNTNIKVNNKNMKSYRTTIYNKVPEQNSDLHLISTEGDRCDSLAYEYYKDAKLWWFIARVNNLKTNNIPAGTKLRIPSSTELAKGY